MLIKDFEGLKFPDEFIIKFFFKESLNTKRGSVLELGCANGNNLNLFYQYGYEVVGIDINGQSIAMANRNFGRLKELFNLSNTFSFIEGNITELESLIDDKSFDIVLLPGVLYYINKSETIKTFDYIRSAKLLKNGGHIFIRMRSVKDYRYNRGNKIGENEFILSTKETGEEGLLNTFFYESELVNLMESFFGFQYKYIFNIDFQNLQNSIIVHNSDIVVWGRVS